MAQTATRSIPNGRVSPGSGPVRCRAIAKFKDGKRSNPIMMPMAAPLSPQDMEDLAAYFDGLVNTGLQADPTYFRAGEKLYGGGDKDRGVPACMACHGPNGHGNEPAKFPSLHGEHSAYIAKELNDYASGARRLGRAASWERSPKD